MLPENHESFAQKLIQTDRSHIDGFHLRQAAEDARQILQHEGVERYSLRPLQITPFSISPTAEAQTQVFGCFHAKYPRFFPPDTL